MARTRSRILAGALVVALVAVLAGCGGDDAETAPPFTADVLGGGELDSASFSGEPTVLWFWAPWCTVCRGEAPDVVAAAEQLEGEVDLVGVAGRGEVPAMEDFVEETGTGGLTHVVDADGTIWSDYGVLSQPSFAFIAPDGTVETVTATYDEQELVDRMEALAA